MAINLRAGRYGASLIVLDGRGNWTMQAERDINTGNSRANTDIFLPPPDINGDFDLVPYGLILIRGAFGQLGPETELFPANLQFDTVLGAGDVGEVQNFVTTYYGTTYSYPSDGNTIDVQGMQASDIPQGIRFDAVILAILDYLQNSDQA